jgi:hypothetical protein
LKYNIKGTIKIIPTQKLKNVIYKNCGSHSLKYIFDYKDEFIIVDAWLKNDMIMMYVVRKTVKSGNTKGESITVQLTSCLAGLESTVSTDNFCFYFQNRLVQTSQTGG